MKIPFFVIPKGPTLTSMLKYFVLACFALLIGVASYLAEDLFFPERPPFKRGSFESGVSQDLKKLQEDSQLPPVFSEIRQVFLSDHRLKKTDLNWKKLSQLYFPQKNDGKYDLQIEVFDSDTEVTTEKSPKDTLVVMQISLFDVRSKNKVSEISRSYKFSDLKK